MPFRLRARRSLSQGVWHGALAYIRGGVCTHCTALRSKDDCDPCPCFFEREGSSNCMETQAASRGKCVICRIFRLGRRGQGACMTGLASSSSISCQNKTTRYGEAVSVPQLPSFAACLVLGEIREGACALHVRVFDGCARAAHLQHECHVVAQLVELVRGHLVVHPTQPANNHRSYCVRPRQGDFSAHAHPSSFLLGYGEGWRRFMRPPAHSVGCFLFCRHHSAGMVGARAENSCARFRRTSNVWMRPSDSVICINTDGFIARFNELVDMATSTRHLKLASPGNLTRRPSAAASTALRLRQRTPRARAGGGRSTKQRHRIAR